MEQTIRKYNDAVRQEIKDGDILLYSGRNIVSLLIRVFTWSRYSHAGIAVHWNNRLMAMESIWPMVIVNPLSLSLQRYKGGVDWCSCTKEILDDKRLEMVKFAQQQLGLHYSLPKLLSFLLMVFFKRRTTERDRLKRYETEVTCSEYVARIYNSIGLDLMKHKADRFTTPKNIAESPLLGKKQTLKK